MTIRKRGNTWQIDHLDPNGKRVRLSFKKKKDAEAELGKRVSLIAENRYLDVKKDYRSTLGELLSKYEEDYQSQRGFKAKKCFLKNIKERIGEVWGKVKRRLSPFPSPWRPDWCHMAV